MSSVIILNLALLVPLCREKGHGVIVKVFVKDNRGKTLLKQKNTSYITEKNIKRTSEMVSGVDLIISAICNASICGGLNDSPQSMSGFRDDLPSWAKSNKMTHKEFINMLAAEINGKHLRVATYINRPMSGTKRDPNSKVGGGVAFYVLDILRDKLNFSYEIIMAKKNFIMGGSNPEDSLIGLVTSGKADMGAAFVADVLDFRKRVAFSNVLDEEKWVIVLKRPKESATGEGLLAPFDDLVWYLILIAVATFGPCIFIFASIRAKLLPEGEPPVTLYRSIWFVYSAFIKQGTNLAPKSNTTRVLFTTWWIFILLLSAFYTANLTAFLTLSEFTLEINGPEDLLRKDKPWVAAAGGVVQYAVRSPSGNKHFLNDMVRKKRAEFQPYTSIGDFFKYVDKGYVMIKSRTGVIHAMYHDYMRKSRQGASETQKCMYVIAPRYFATIPRGFIYPKNSTLRILFDHILGTIVQSGVIEQLKMFYLPRTKICPMDLQLKERQLENTDLLMTYQITTVGFAVAILIFIGEVISKRCNNKCRKRNAVKSNKTTLERGYTTVHHFQTNDDPPPYDTIMGKTSKIKLPKGVKTKVVNGREYMVLDTPRGIRLIPMRTPSALLYKQEKLH